MGFILDSTGFYWVLLGFTGFYWVLLGFTGFDWVWLGFTGFDWVLMGLTAYWMVSSTLAHNRHFTNVDQTRFLWPLLSIDWHLHGGLGVWVSRIFEEKRYDDRKDAREDVRAEGCAATHRSQIGRRIGASPSASFDWHSAQPIKKWTPPSRPGRPVHREKLIDRIEPEARQSDQCPPQFTDYWVFFGFTGFYWVLLGFTGFYCVFTGF